jgi:hypothetical protein
MLKAHTIRQVSTLAELKKDYNAVLAQGMCWQIHPIALLLINRLTPHPR